MKKITKAIIPVAGMGTRMLPATKAVAKEMLPIYDKPTLQYLIEECVDAGITDVIFITSSTKKVIEDHFDISYELEDRLKKASKDAELKVVQDLSQMVNIYYVRQGEPKGNGHAISLAKSFIEDGEYFAILFGDDIIDSNTDKSILRQMVEMHEELGGNVIPAETMTKEDVMKYNAIVFKDEKQIEIESIMEKPDEDKIPSLVCSCGRYLLNSTIFKELETVEPYKGEIYLSMAMREHMKKEAYYACHYDGKYFDTGSPLALLKTNLHMAFKKPEVAKELKEFLKKYI